MASNPERMAVSSDLGTFAAPNYDFNKLLPWLCSDKYYLQATEQGFQEMLCQNGGKIEEPNSFTLVEIGKRALNNGELQIAEQSFGKAIRKERLREHRSKHNLEVFYYLADVLEKKAKRDDVELDKKQRLLLQAASLYNFVINCLKLDSEDNDRVKEMSKSLPLKLKDIEDSLVSMIGGNLSRCEFNCDNKINDLKQLRNEVKQMLNSLEQCYDDIDETNENHLRDIFVKQTEDIKRICEMISSRFKQFFFKIIEECLEVLGKPPCKYEVLVLGSLARNEMTPYSDIEWAILIGSEEEQCKVFFRNLTNLVHLQIINLGETILPAMGIEMLSGDWFFDDITPRGISFDGFLPGACKTPLGNMQDFELIHSPVTMAKFQTTEMHLKNPCLAEVLLTVGSLQSQNQVLFNEYKTALESELCKSCASDSCHHTTVVSQAQCRGMDTLRKDVSRYEELITGRYSYEDGKLYDVKKEIYRLTDRVVAGLAKCFGSTKCESFEILNDLHQKGVLSSYANENIASAVGIALKLRNITYLKAGKQGEEMNSDRSEKENKPAYNMPKEKELFHFFYVTIPLYFQLCQFCNENDVDSIAQESFFDYSDKIKGDVYCRLLNYTKALQCYEQALALHPSDTKLQLCLLRVKFIADTSCGSTFSKNKLDALHFQMCKKYSLPENIELLGHALSQSKCDINNEDKNSIFEILRNTSGIHRLEGNFELARKFLHQCLIGKSQLGLDDLQTLMVWTDYLKIPTVRREVDIKEFENIIHLLTSFIQEEGVSAKGCILLNELGEVFLLQKNYHKAYQCLQRALSMARHIFGPNGNFLVIKTLTFLGLTSLCLLIYDESKFYLQEALKVFSFTGQSAHMVKCSIHLMIARVYNITGEYYTALSHLQDCIDLSNKTSPHTAALTHCTQASTWVRLGEREKAYNSALDARVCLQNILDVEVKAVTTCAVAKTFVEAKRCEDGISLIEDELLALDSSRCHSDLRALYLQALGEICVGQELVSEGLRYYTECLKMFNVKNVNTSGILDAHLAIANLLRKTDAIYEASVHLKKGWNLVLSMGDGDEKHEFMKKIAQCWEKMGNIQQAQHCYKEALAAVRFIERRKVPLFEYDLMVKLGDLAKITSDDKRNGLSREQGQKAQRAQYDRAAEVLRRHSTSGNFNSQSILLFVLLADKYRSIDVCEQEKLLLEALQMCDVVYPPNEASEMAVGILCDLSDLYWDRSNMSKSSDYYVRAFKMEMELHSSDPYHKHISGKIAILSHYLFADSGNDELRNFIKDFAEFVESVQGQIGTATYEQKTNSAEMFTSISLLFIYLGDLTKSRLFHTKASEIFDTLEEEGRPSKSNSSLQTRQVVGTILDIFSESTASEAAFSQIISNGLVANFFLEEMKKNSRLTKRESAFHSLDTTVPRSLYSVQNDSSGITVKNEVLSKGHPFLVEAIKKLDFLENHDMNDTDQQSYSAMQEKQDKTESGNDVHVTHSTEQLREILNPISICETRSKKEQSTADTDHKKMLQELSTISSKITVLGDSVKHDILSNNFRQARESNESFNRLVVSASKKGTPDLTDVIIQEALRCKKEKRMGFMPPYLNLSARLTSDRKKKAEIATLMAESHFCSRRYKIATIQYSKAAAYYSCHTNSESVAEYLETLLGLISSHMFSNDLEEANGVCEKAIEFASSLECGILKCQYEAEFSYLAATCLIKLAKMKKQITNTTFENVTSYCQRAMCVIEIAEQLLGPSDVVEELTGDVRGKLFTLKCEIQLLLAASFLKLGKKEQADDITKGMSEFLENISAVLQMFSDETWPEDKIGFSTICRHIHSWIGRAQSLSGRIEHAIGSLEESILLFVSDYEAINFEQENFLDVLDAFTATKNVVSENEIPSFSQTLQFCKEKFLEKHDDIKKLMIFFETLASCYVECNRTEEAIVVYEFMLPIAECLQSSTKETQYSTSQVLLFLGSCHQRLAFRSSGEKAADERRLAEKYYRIEAGTNTNATLIRKVEYLKILSEENRFKEAIEIINQIFDVGDEIWDMIVVYAYSSRARVLFARSYLSDHGELLTSVGCLAYSTILRVFLLAGMKKEAVETCEKLSKQCHDVEIFGDRPSFMPYLLTYCHKELVSFLEKKHYLQDSDFPLSDEKLAQVYYEIGEYDVALEYCTKVLTPVGSTESEHPGTLKKVIVQKKLDCLLISANALVLLGRGENAYSYYISFLELLELQKGILKASFEDQQIILQTYDVADLFYIYRSLGILLCRAGYIDSAMKAYEYCIGNLTVNHKHGNGLVGTLADLYQTKAFTSFPDDNAAYLMWMDKAKKLFENYFQSEDNPDPFVETTFGALLCRLEEYDQAIAHLENVLQQSQELTIKFGKEDIPLVDVYFAREIETRKEVLLPIKIYASFLTANAYKKLKKIKSAEEAVSNMSDFCSLLKSDPNYSLIHSVLGYTYKVIGNNRKAAEIFQSVLAMKPNHAPVTTALQSCALTDEHT